MTTRTAAEFFSGIGLVRLGLDRSDWTSVFSNDIDPDKCRMYAQNFSDSPAVLVPDDIRRLSGDQIPSVTLATASFPCNDLSLAGSRNGIDGAQSGSFWQFVRLLNEMGDRRPKIILLENVPGFLTSHGGMDFQRSMIALNELGYAVDPFMVDASHFAPQSRLRLFVVGSRIDSSLVARREALLKCESEVRPRSLAKFVFEHPEIVWSIRDLPRLPKRAKKLEDILEDIPLGAPNWWNMERSTYLLNQMSIKHRKIADEMIAGGNWSYGTVFRRVRNGRSMAELRTDGIAGCLRTPRGGSGRQILFAAGQGLYGARLLTPRECARLQGVPEDYVIDVTLNQALFGFGDAVCVPVIEWIAKNYLSPVAEYFALDQTQGTVAAYA